MAAKPSMSRTNPAREARAFSSLDSCETVLTTWLSLLQTFVNSLTANRRTTTRTTTTPARTLPASWLKNRQASMQITPRAIEHNKCSAEEVISKEHSRSSRWPNAVARKANSMTASSDAEETANAIAYAGWAKGWAGIVL